MVATPPYQQQDSAFQSAQFADPAFDSHPGFDFAEFNDGIMRGMQDDSIVSLNAFNHGGYSGFGTDIRQSHHGMSSFSPFPFGTSAFGQDMGASVDPSDMSANRVMSTGDFANGKSSYFLPPTAQSSIAFARSDSVAEKYGQVTPPDSTPPEGRRKSSSVSVQSGKTTKPSKSDRARDAANQRHSKAKQTRPARETRATSKSTDAAEDDDEEDVEVKKEKYREKNRIAAAKCRAKKKDNTDGLEETFRDLQASHNFLTREARKLRDEYSTLRTLALQHAPDTPGCNCSQIYTYNQCQAGEVVRNLGAPLLSPTDSMLSPSAFGGGSRMGSFSGGPLADMYGRSQSFSAASNAAFPTAPPPNAYKPVNATLNDAVLQDFSGYLQGSVENGVFQS
ncbi:hypothetical protein LTR56_020450 [Elasticomyces elasticus]|nr:hypothetical protein LTR56_020450 [Elasticomyces elasticus]KAK3645820.1 hypothetical protein LTR22_014588 [Elasticomyces elasticus]KAK4910569.1 hypothetical protein LTR49_020773 [Elasticomyces elasticus]KAK5747300.1 hypothetical protein LTS12_022450 [Elasticomyces elasticus]